jgi:hypothetical protein
VEATSFVRISICQWRIWSHSFCHRRMLAVPVAAAPNQRADLRAARVLLDAVCRASSSATGACLGVGAITFAERTAAVNQ